MTIATVLREAREAKNLTQEALAYSAGVSLSTIQRLEAGRPTTPATLFKIAKLLGVKPDSLAEAFDKQPA